MHQLTDEQLATIISWGKKPWTYKLSFCSANERGARPSLTAMWSWRSRSQGRTRYGGSPPSLAAVVPGGESLRQPLVLRCSLSVRGLTPLRKGTMSRFGSGTEAAQ
jgi:hypothetical protein